MVLSFSPKEILISLRLRSMGGDHPSLPSFHLAHLLLRSNPPDANLSAYLPVWLPVVGIRRGLYFLHLTESRLCGAAVVYAYEIGLIWLEI